MTGVWPCYVVKELVGKKAIARCVLLVPVEFIAIVKSKDFSAVRG